MSTLEIKNNTEALRSKIKDKIDSLGITTLERLLTVVESSIEPELGNPLTTDELQNKNLRKKEENIYMQLLNLMKKEHKKSTKVELFPYKYKEKFSLDEFGIKEILEKSSIIHRIGLNERISMINNLPRFHGNVPTYSIYPSDDPEKPLKLNIFNYSN